MREYETIYILQPQLSEAQLKTINGRIKDLIERHDGRLFYARNMGTKNLAYRIKKQSKGVYYALDYVAAGDCVADLERTLLLDENVLRFLTVVKNKKVDVEARAAEIEARGEGLSMPEEKESEAKSVSKEEEESKEE